MRLGGVSAVLSALLGVLSLVLYLIVVGGNSLSEAATSATFFSSRAGHNCSPCCCWRSASWRCTPGRRRGSGRSGFSLALIGTTLAADALWTQVFVVPRLAEAPPEVAGRGMGSVLAGFLLSFLIFGVGGVVLGVATLRTRVFPRWAVILLIVGAVLAILPFSSKALLLEIAVACLGYPFDQEGGGGPALAAGELGGQWRYETASNVKGRFRLHYALSLGWEP